MQEEGCWTSTGCAGGLARVYDPRSSYSLLSSSYTCVCAGDMVLHNITVLKIKREIKYPIYDQKPIESTADMVAAQCQFHMAVRDICRGEEGGGRIHQGFERHTCRSGYRSRKTGCCGHNVKISGRELAAFRPRGWREPKVHMQNPLMTLQIGMTASRVHLHVDPSFHIIQVLNPASRFYNYHLPQVFSVALSVDGFRSRGRLLLIVLYVHHHFFASCGFLFRRCLKNSVMLLIFTYNRWILVTLLFLGSNYTIYCVV